MTRRWTDDPCANAYFGATMGERGARPITLHPTRMGWRQSYLSGGDPANGEVCRHHLGYVARGAHGAVVVACAESSGVPGGTRTTVARLFRAVARMASAVGAYRTPPWVEAYMTSKQVECAGQPI